MKKLAVFLLIGLVWACNEPKKEPKPNGLIPSQKFVAIMFDVQLAEGMKTQRVDFSDGKHADPAFLYRDIFKKHKITRSEFNKTYKYYRLNPGKMEVIYEQVLDSLSKLDAEVKQEFAIERQERSDSLKQVREERRDSLRALRRSDEN